MSHVTASEMTFASLRDLQAAAAAMDAEIVEKATFKWYGKWMNDWNADDAAYRRGISTKDYGKCDYVLRPKTRQADDYEVGLVRQADGSYRPVYDTWGSGAKLIKHFGNNLSRFKQQYAACATKRTMKKKGYRVTTKQQPDGSLKVECWR